MGIRLLFLPYFFAGTEGVTGPEGGAGIAGGAGEEGEGCTGGKFGSADVAGAGASVCLGITEEPPTPLLPKKAIVKDVIINMIAAIVVSLPKKLPGPLLPNMVWLEAPPKDAPISAPLPD